MNMMTFNKCLGLLCIVITCVSCSHLQPSDVREKAIEARDNWIKADSPKDAVHLRRGEILSIESTYTGWHVTFITRTGGGPEGMDNYILHVYLKRDGSLKKVVRGPDIMS